MSDGSDFATRRAVMDTPAIGEELPPVRSAVLDELDAAISALQELDAAISALQIALDYCRGNAAALQRVRRAAGRLRIAATLRPDLEPVLQPAIDRLDDAIDCIGWVGCGTIKTVKDEVEGLQTRMKEEQA